MNTAVEPGRAEHELPEEAFVVSMTDRSGRITYANRTFLEITGYTESELLGKPHSLLRDPLIPRTLYRMLWEALKRDDEFVMFIASLGKDGSRHWGFSTFIPSHDPQGHVIGYYSVRRRAAPGAVATIAGIYRAMREEEQRMPGDAGMDAGLNLLNNILAEKGMSYEQFVFGLQAA